MNWRGGESRVEGRFNVYQGDIKPAFFLDTQTGEVSQVGSDGGLLGVGYTFRGSR